MVDELAESGFPDRFRQRIHNFLRGFDNLPGAVAI